MHYIFIDYLKSRQGKILVFSVISLLGLVYLLSSTEQEEEPQKPPIQKNIVWEEDYNNQQAPTPQTKKYESFVPFVPRTPEFDTHQTEKPKVISTPVIPISAIPTPLQSPLIKEQRKRTQVAAKKEAAKPVNLPSLETGTILHCQLSTPATTDNPNSPVIAVVTQSLARDGITIIPKGSQIFGNVQNSQNNRIFFASNWTLITPNNDHHNLSGYVQEKSYDVLTNELLVSDGRLGLPGSIQNHAKPKKLGAKVIGTLVKGIAQFSKETVRTSVGEFVPSSGRNAAINGSSEAIDHLLTTTGQSNVKQKSYIHVSGGKEFYLIVSESKGQQNFHTNEASIDQLLNEAVKLRLQE